MRDLDAILKQAHAIGMQQHDAEIRWLVDILDANPPRRMVEIGIGTGGLNYLWGELNPVARLVSVDIVDRPPSLRGDYVRGDSHAHDTRLELVKLSPFDFAFIDGDHSYEGVKQDFDLCRQLVAPGLIALHDIVDSEYHHRYNCYVSKLWAELKERYFTREIITSNWGGIGVVRV